MLIHGMAKTHFWIKWYSMRQRCLNKNSSTYYKYGAKGIKICKEWDNFICFRSDMYETYLKHVNFHGETNTTLDRIDPSGNYFKENCRWATQKQQQRNKINNRILEFKGKKRCLAEWADIVGVNQDTLERRLNLLNWSIEKALTTPTRKHQYHL